MSEEAEKHWGVQLSEAVCLRRVEADREVGLAALQTLQQLGALMAAALAAAVALETARADARRAEAALGLETARAETSSALVPKPGAK